MPYLFHFLSRLLIVAFSVFFISNAMANTLSSAVKPPTILASIRPLGLLAQEVIGEHGTVQVLLPSNTSPHHYALSVSDRQRLQSTDIVLWIGEDLERFLVKPIQQRKVGVITAMTLDGISWPENEGGAHQHEANDHHHGDHDPHLWLNPLNSLPIVDALVAKLRQLAPEYAAYYEENAKQLKSTLEQLDQQLLQETVFTAPFIVAHPAYQHFVARYGLLQLDYVVDVPERRAGAKHLYRLRQLASAQCVFIDYGWVNAGAAQLAEDLSVPLLSLNPFGVAEQRGHISIPESTSITQLIKRLAKDFQACS